MTWRNPLFVLLDLLRLESTARHIALGVTLGCLLGLTPLLTLHWAIFFVALFVLRTNLLAAGLSAVIFQLVALFAEPFFHTIGNFVLTETPNLKRLWAGLYHAPVITFTHFNNTVVMGSLLVCLALAPALYVATLVFWKRYGSRFSFAVHNSALGLSWSTSFLYRAYAKHRSYYH